MKEIIESILSGIKVGTIFFAAPILSIFMILFYGQYIESTFLPVYDDFFIVPIAEIDNGYKVNIYGYKKRACSPVENTIGWYTNSHGENVRIYIEPFLKDTIKERPLGLNNFGIWTIIFDDNISEVPDNISLLISHNCGQPLWNISTEYYLKKFSNYKELSDYLIKYK